MSGPSGEREGLPNQIPMSEWPQEHSLLKPPPCFCKALNSSFYKGFLQATKDKGTLGHGGCCGEQPHRPWASLRGHSSWCEWRPKSGPYRHFLPRPYVVQRSSSAAFVARAHGTNQAQFSASRGRRQWERCYRVSRQWERHGPTVWRVGAQEVVIFIYSQWRGHGPWDTGEETVHESLRYEGVSWKVRKNLFLLWSQAP